MVTRDDWDMYFMKFAQQAATRATCPRKHVGSVFVRDRHIIATGYNGSIAGMPHCDEVGCMMIEGHCERTVHAETNAIAMAAKYGISLKEATCYTTASPCWPCFKMLINSGIRVVKYGEFYRKDERVINTAAELGVLLFHVDTNDGKSIEDTTKQLGKDTQL